MNKQLGVHKRHRLFSIFTVALVGISISVRGDTAAQSSVQISSMVSMAQSAKGNERAKAISAIHPILSAQPHYKFSANGFSSKPVPFGSESFQLEQQSMQALIDLGDESAIDEILSRDELVVGANAMPLIVSKFGARALAKVAAIGKDKNDPRNIYAHRAIASIRDENAVPQLIQMLKDPDLHSSSAYALGQIGAVSTVAERAVDSSYNAMTLRDKADYLHQVIVISSGARASSPRPMNTQTMTKATNLLSESIKERDSLVEYETLQALVATRDPRIVPILENYLKDPQLPQRDPQLLDRTLAAWGLWKITGKRYEIPTKRPLDKKWINDEWNKLDLQEKQLDSFGK